MSIPSVAFDPETVTSFGEATALPRVILVAMYEQVSQLFRVREPNWAAASTPAAAHSNANMTAKMVSHRAVEMSSRRAICSEPVVDERARRAGIDRADTGEQAQRGGSGKAR